MDERAAILIVEDESLVALDLEERLTNLGYRVAGTASRADEALRKARELLPDLILMDIVLSGSADGIDAAEEIRNALSIPVIYVTAHADAETLERAKGTVPYGYILKPFREIELRTAVELALHRSAHEQPSSVPPDAPDSEAEVDEKRRPLLQLLERLDIFSDAAPGVRRLLAAHATVSTYAAGSIIAFEGDADVSAFLVLSGRVAMTKGSPAGKELIVELLPPGDPFGLVAALDSAPYPATLRAQTESTICWIPRRIVLEGLRSQPSLYEAITREVFERLRQSHDFSRSLAHDRVEVRVASALLALVPRFVDNPAKGRPTIEIPRQELAELTGSTAETVTRAIKTLQRSGVLTVSRTGAIGIKDRGALRAIAEGA